MLKLPALPWPRDRAARAADKAARAQQKAEKRRQRLLAKEARYYAKLLSKKLERLDICYRYPRSSKDFLTSGTERVQFERAVTTDESIWLKIDASKLPRGVKLSDINKEEILLDLSDVSERPVRFEQRIGGGSWLVIERDAAYAGIKKRLDFTEIMANYPEHSRKVLLVPVGAGRNRTLHFESIDEWPHALIGGATKSGKTTFMHTWLCCLLSHNRPEMLKFVLIDLKGGVEFTRYKRVPHLLEGGFVKSKEEVAPILRRLQGMIDHRLALFEEMGGIQNVAAWNFAGFAPRLYRVIVFVDELASLMLEPDLKKEAEALLTDIGNRGRAPGIHLVIGTQRPDTSVVSGRIKGNLDARFGFRVPDGNSSMVILDDWSASEFPADTPKGRFIFKFGNERREIQAPLITANQISDIISNLENADGLRDALERSPDELFKVAVSQLQGKFAVQTLYKTLSGKYPLEYIRKIAQNYEGKTVDVDGILYQLIPGEKNQPRCLVQVTDGDIEGNSPASESEEQDTGHRTQEEVAEPDNGLELFKVALFNLEGFFSIRGIYDAFNGEIARKKIEEIGKKYEGQTIEIDGVFYVLEPGAGKRPRRLVEIETQEEE